MKKILCLVVVLLSVALVTRGQDASSAGDAPPPLPPASALNVVLSTDYDFGEIFTPAEVTNDVSVVLPKIYVTVSATAGIPTFAFSARIVAVDVRGVVPGAVVVAETETSGAEINANKKSNYVEVFFPTAALLPGKYRVEVIDYETKQRVVTSAALTAHLPTLPKPEDLAVVLRRTDLDHDYDEAIEPTTDFPSWPGRIHVVVNGPADLTLGFSARLVSEDVPGLSPGEVLGAVAENASKVLLIDPEHPSAIATLLFPRMGLPAGKYRVEIVEGNALQRVIKTVAVTAHASELAEAEFNLADAEFGGLLESVSGEDGAGYTWAPQLLSRENRKIWYPVGPPQSGVDFDHLPANLPVELVISFFQHEAALVSAVEFISRDTDGSLPKDVEIWGSTQSATEGFTRLATTTLDENKAVSRIEFPPTSVKSIKIKISSVTQPDTAIPLTLMGMRVIEGKAEGYVALAKRLPAVADWRVQPRHAAQSGLNFLQPTVVRWQMDSACLGCHVQSQALMGISVARKSDYVVSALAEKYINDFAYQCQSPNGGFSRSIAAQDIDVDPASTSFSAAGLAYGPHSAPEKSEQLVRAAKYLTTLQTDEGTLSDVGSRAPIEQGDIMHVSNALENWSEALKIKEDPELRKAFVKSLAFVAGAETATTQDKTFKIMSLARFGSDAQKKTARQLALKLEQEQQPDGGWKIEADAKGSSSPFATGQVLYAFRLAGINPNAAVFRRGVLFLIVSQEPAGSWRDEALSSRFAATMWPVIALAGAFGSQVEPGHIMVSALPRPVVVPLPTPSPTHLPDVPVESAPPVPILPKTIEFVLDCSFSMYDSLGKSTRIDTAKQVMRDLIEHLPDDTKAGLRLYGHRYDSMSLASSKDTELVVPIGPIDRKAMLEVIAKAKPRGQTPLVYSTLQAGDDLKKIGGGVIIVVTDGEESCGGKPRKAGEQLAALGVPLRLDIIGFTLTGKRVVDDLTAFTQSTGGRYYTAADGAALSKALRDATAPAPRMTSPIAAAPPPPLPVPEPVVEDFPFEILDEKGRKVASSSTLSGEVPDLPPGIYQVVLHDGAKQAVVPALKLGTSETVELSYTPATTTLTVKN